ncbi:hypothetical protein [Metaclostridioides mangenotii]|nr:hypothetical protein [Clostridioides mangenotii]
MSFSLLLANLPINVKTKLSDSSSRPCIVFIKCIIFERSVGSVIELM